MDAQIALVEALGSGKGVCGWYPHAYPRALSGRLLVLDAQLSGCFCAWWVVGRL